ncbi:hypothetical protein E0H36_31985 [Rhizobium leguminosarum bv. viciae]|jgi:hypothetical protein|uniref:hypothetical protein n=1 Tax=Rhizobium leguminosarum TaxID=384 RepID=UPI000B9282E8|nr:hypothetical protein [Rhizobium leguminosarum]ASS53327.1 hypothetical protein CHR56_01295 [Rhizobium leguminosarum bv. viciae]TBZ27176.1 hypothetical protein E0H36_31985 [Rhizobium leguminosarum bv. viciae]TBZ35033.1 hypothetical protein E0H47_25130 [Rhizobium leguminosarum bv. viciae]TBZ93186.1 hypothetical protein E0H63_36100 [Rhizobium leguminosarum bv. viciae]
MTRIRQIIRYMKEVESGFDRTLLPLPSETVFLKPDGPISGKYLPLEADADDEEDYSGLADLPWVWQPTLEPTPSRWYPARTKGHSRGSIVNPKTRKGLTHSSTYEMNLAYMLCASRHISLVEDQPSAVPIIQEDGTQKHTIDYRATMAETGTRIVVAVRPTWLLDKDGLPYTIDSINRHSLEGFADEATIMTEREITHDRGWNAYTILRALKHSAADDNDRLRDYASKFHGTVSLRSLISVFENPACAWNAVWCLVHDEILLPIRPDLKLVDAPFVKFNHNH